MNAIDPAVHAALVVIFTYLVNLLFKYLGIDLGGEIATQLAQIIVAYILSLLGLGLWFKVADKTPGLRDRVVTYKPPFV